MADASCTPFDPESPSTEDARKIVLERLRNESTWSQLPVSGSSGFDPYVEYVGEERRARTMLVVYAREVMWHLIVEGIITPGLNSSNLDLPHFRITAYGRRVLDEGDVNPHDPTGYVAAVRRRVAQPDRTVTAYLAESATTFRRGSLVAAMVMLGIAAERVFDLLCDSMHAALKDPAEQQAFGAILGRFQMKPKLDWVHGKLETLRSSHPQGIPENSLRMVTVVYDLLRIQRNDLGHPSENPPRMSRDDAFTNLQIFPMYYAAAEKVRTFLAANQV